MSVFGFSTEPSKGGDFTPIIKYNARAGKVFRIDRADNGAGFENEEVDITSEFKAIMDLENIEVGWVDFVAGSAPNFALVKMGEALPPRPSDRHKNCVRFMLKLAKSCGGDKPIREIASPAKVFLNGVEALYKAYEKERAANPGKLPVVTLTKVLPVKTGSGERMSTNYQPVFAITSWAPRGDLVFAPKAGTTTGGDAVADERALPLTPPSTGSTKVSPPKAKAKEAELADADDFG